MGIEDEKSKLLLNFTQKLLAGEQSPSDIKTHIAFRIAVVSLAKKASDPDSENYIRFDAQYEVLMDVLEYLLSRDGGVGDNTNG